MGERVCTCVDIQINTHTVYYTDEPSSSFDKSLLLLFYEHRQCETHITLGVSNSNNFYFSLSRSVYGNTKNERRVL